MAIKETKRKSKPSKVEVIKKDIDKAIKELKKDVKNPKLPPSVKTKKTTKKDGVFIVESTKKHAERMMKHLDKEEKKANKKPVQWKEEIKGKYTLIIYMNNEVFATKTDDVYASLRNFTPSKITNKVIITLKEGDRYAERVMRVYPARRTFAVPLATEFVAKNLVLRLK